MNELLARIIDAHGGMERWRGYEKVEATIVSGGGLFALKGVLQDSSPRRMTVWLHEERSSVSPYGAPDQRTMFTPERIAIEKLDGTLVAERRAPRDSFAGRAIDRRLCDGERHSPSHQAPRLYARSRPPADYGNADGVDRHQRGRLQVENQPHRQVYAPFRLPRAMGFPGSDQLQLLEPCDDPGCGRA